MTDAIRLLLRLLYTVYGTLLELFINVHCVVLSVGFVWTVSSIFTPRGGQTGARILDDILALPGALATLHDGFPDAILLLGDGQGRGLSVEHQFVALRLGRGEDQLGNGVEVLGDARQEGEGVFGGLDVGDFAIEIMDVDSVFGVVEEHGVVGSGLGGGLGRGARGIFGLFGLFGLFGI